MFRPPKMVSYRVPDLPRAREWYSRVLGHPPAFDSPMASVFAVGDSSLTLLPLPEGGEAKAAAGNKDFQIFYFYPDDVAGLHAEFSAKGLPVTALRVTIYGMKEFELRDPDGYWLWFGQDTNEPATVRE